MLVREAVERGCGSLDDCSVRQLIGRLMMDGGEDVVESVLQNPAMTFAELIRVSG